MAKRIGHVVLIGALLISVFHGICARDSWDSWDDWSTNLSENINRHVENVIQGVHERIQHTIRHSIEPALENAARTIENIPKDEHGRFVSTGNTIIINNGNGRSRSVISSYKDGEPYVRDVEERRDGSVLYHYETYYQPNTNTSVRTCWKLDHAQPGAIPEILKDC